MARRKGREKRSCFYFYVFWGVGEFWGKMSCFKQSFFFHFENLTR